MPPDDAKPPTGREKLLIIVIRHVRLPNPWITDRSAPGMPTGRKVGKLPDQRVQLENLREAQNDTIVDARVSPAKELPAVIVIVVGDMEDGLVPIRDLP